MTKIRNHIQEDVAHEVFIRAYKSLPSFKFKSGFKQWLSSIAVRTCYDNLRKQYRNKEIVVSGLTEGHQDILDRLTSKQAEREYFEKEQQKEMREILAWALAQVSPEDRNGVIMKQNRDPEKHVIKALAEAYNNQPSTEISSNWQQNIMREIRSFGPLQSEEQNLLEDIAYYMWRLAPVSVVLSVLLFFILTKIEVGPEYELSQVFFNDQTNVSFYQSLGN